MASFGVILAAAGKSSRFKNRSYKKPFAPLSGKAVWLHSAELFLKRQDVKQVVLVISPEDRETVESRFGPNLAIWGIEIVEGGAERADSVQRGLAALGPDVDYVAVHDAARPCLSNDMISRAFSVAIQHGAAVVGIPVTSTLKRVDREQTIQETIDRTGAWLSQTPQVIKRSLLEQAYRDRGDYQPTDESQLLERAGISAKMVEGSPLNIKITTADDLKFAQLALKALPMGDELGILQPDFGKKPFS